MKPCVEAVFPAARPLLLSVDLRRRRHLERLKPAGSKEVLLSPDGRRLLEGLVTNLFVIRSRRHPQANTADQAESKTEHQKGQGEVETAHKGVGPAGGSLPGREDSKSGGGRQADEFREDGEGSFQGLEVVTAPLEGYGVLPGSIRRVVLE